MFLTKLSDTDSMRVAWGPDVLSWDLCLQPSTMQLDWHLQENTTIGRFTIGALFSSQMSAGSQLAHARLKESWVFHESRSRCLLPSRPTRIGPWWMWVPWVGWRWYCSCGWTTCRSWRSQESIEEPCGHWVWVTPQDLLRIHADTSSRDDVPEKGGGGARELAFNEEAVLQESAKHLRPKGGVSR